MLSLARAGAVSISIDAPWARPEPWKTEDEGGHITHPEVDRDIYVQTVVDLRRAVDILLSRNDVDPKRIGFVGHSYGATWGGVLAGVEKRIRTYVLMAGLPDVADFTPSGAKDMDSISEQVKAKFTPQQVQHYVDTVRIAQYSGTYYSPELDATFVIISNQQPPGPEAEEVRGRGPYAPLKGQFPGRSSGPAVHKKWAAQHCRFHTKYRTITRNRVSAQSLTAFQL